MNAYAIGALALALVISGSPVIALANQSTSTLEAGREDAQMQGRIEFENSTTSVRSLEDLKIRIEQNRQEMDRDDVGTTSEDFEGVKSAHSMRLAVRTLLDSRELLGGIGSRVSAIAKEMNDSATTTTEAETKIHSRGFLTRFFFGGDRDTAANLALEVAHNQKLIENLVALLDQATLSADVRAALNTQIAALKESQIRLGALVDREMNNWGVFSWRFGTQ